MLEGIGNDLKRDRFRSFPDGQLEQCLRRLFRKTAGDFQETVLVGVAYVLQRFRRHPVAQQLTFGNLLEQGRLRRRLLLCFHECRNGDFFNRLSQFDKLGGAGRGVGDQLAPFGPLVGFVVVIHVAEQQALPGPMDDHPDVAIDPDGPEPGIAGSIQLVESVPRLCRVQLQIEGGGLRHLLLVTGQLGQTAGEGVGDEEVHVKHPASFGSSGMRPGSVRGRSPARPMFPSAASDTRERLP